MLSYTQKRELKANQRRILIDSINIQLASPLQIKSWAQRRLPTGAVIGQVTNSKTLDYKNHKPLKDGLFCERIFGPVRDFVCACGKQQPKDGTKYCLQCGVEFTRSRVRRLRLGYIQLASSVTHIWFLKGRPSYLSLLLGKKKRLVVAIAYCNAFFVEQDFPVTRPKEYGLKKLEKNSTCLTTFSLLKNHKYARHVESTFSKTILSIGTTTSTIHNNHDVTLNHFQRDATTPFKSQKLRREQKKTSFMGFYSQAQTLPFLPSLATTYLTRAALVNYLLLFPKKEDRPLSSYHQATRWWPLVDIHDFLAEQPLQTLNGLSWLSREKEGIAKKNTQSVESFRERVESLVAEREEKGLQPKAVGKTDQFERKNSKPARSADEVFHKSIGSLIFDVLEPKVAERVENSMRSKISPKVQHTGDTFGDGQKVEKEANKKERFLFETQNAHLSSFLTNPPPSEDTLSHTDKAAIKEILSYTGGGALETLLKRFDMALLTSFLSSDLQDIHITLKRLLKNPKETRAHTKLTKLLKRLLRRRGRIARRFKLAKLCFQTKRKPEWMMLSVLPVLPPKLRPIERRDGLSYTSDLNRLYQMVLNRNRRFQKLIVVDISTVTATQRLLQDAVDGLLENGKGGSKPFSHPNGHPLISLSDKLKGKKGRFRLNLLGKRVDYSGRSVIVVEPKLKLHECGLPEEMALELFRFFLIRQLVVKGEASNIIMAKRLLKQRLPFIWNTLRELINYHPILLNRAPTLHRLGIQAFQPKLISGSAIKLHPLVCSSFNADFDGDQMAVHVPLSFHARAEAWNLLWSRNNLLSPATGQPILVPSQDMVLGWYYVTTMYSQRLKPLKTLDSGHSRSLTKEGFSTNRAHPKENNLQTLNGVSVPKLTKMKVFEVDLILDSFKSTILSSNLAIDIVPRIQPLAAQNGNQGEEKKDKDSVSVHSVNKKYFKEYFSDLVAVLRAYYRQDLDLHSPIWVRFEGILECNNELEKPLELRIDGLGNNIQLYTRYQRQIMKNNPKPTLFVRTTPGRVLVNSLVHSRIS